MLDQICNQIFEKCSGPEPLPGRIVWHPVANLEEVPRVLEVERASPTEHYATNFQIAQMDVGHFKDKEKLPIKLLKLQGTEELLISKAKKRPCVVLSLPNTGFADHSKRPEISRKRHLWDGAVLLAPLYGIETAGDDRGFPPIMVARIKAMLYNQFFHVPKTCHLTRIGMSQESIIRLDRIFSALPAARAMHMEDYRLSNEPLQLLLATAQERIGGQTDGNLTMVRDLLDGALPDEARPQA